MGQAFDRNGHILGEAFGETKREVFDKLSEQFKDAHEIRIRTIPPPQGLDNVEPFGDTKRDVVNAGPQTEMPRYRSHKTVWALKIAAVTHDSALAATYGDESDGSARITPADEGYAEFRVDAEYVRKHNPQPGGYFVVYADGYASFSPAEAFESGYTRIP